MHKRAVQLRELLTKLGPSFVKVGQALSSRPDLLPKPYLEVHSMMWFAAVQPHAMLHCMFSGPSRILHWIHNF